MKETSGSLKLKKIDLTDVPDITELNPNFDTLDSEITTIKIVKVDKVLGKGLSSNDYTTDEKNKLSGIANEANHYVHPNDVNTRHVTDAEKSVWNSKETVEGATTKANQALVDAKTYTNGITDIKADKTYVDSELAKKAPTHLHPYEPQNANIQTHVASPHAPSNAQANVQADWNATVGDAFIKNKPTSLPANGGNSATVGGFTVGKSVPSDALFTDTIYTHPNDINTRHVTDAEKSVWNEKANTAVVTTSTNGLMSSEDKTKLDGVAEGANNYTHPTTHTPSVITQDANNRFVTDVEKITWNEKADKPYVDNKTGNISELQTVDKTNLVSAINELKRTGGSGTGVNLNVFQRTGGIWGEFTATQTTNTFTIQGFDGANQCTSMYYKGIPLIPNKQFNVNVSGIVTLGFQLTVGETVDYCVSDVSFDYEELANKPNLSLKADKTYTDQQDSALQGQITTLSTQVKRSQYASISDFGALDEEFVGMNLAEMFNALQTRMGANSTLMLRLTSATPNMRQVIGMGKASTLTFNTVASGIYHAELKYNDSYITYHTWGQI